MRTIVHSAFWVRLATVASVCGALNSYAADEKASPPAVGDKAHDFALPDLKGN